MHCWVFSKMVKYVIPLHTYAMTDTLRVDVKPQLRGASRSNHPSQFVQIAFKGKRRTEIEASVNFGIRDDVKKCMHIVFLSSRHFLHLIHLIPSPVQKMKDLLVLRLIHYLPQKVRQQYLKV